MIMRRNEVYVMVVKEEALVKLLCGCGEAFYIEDIFGEEINTKAVEKLYRTFVDMIKLVYIIHRVKPATYIKLI